MRGETAIDFLDRQSHCKAKVRKESEIRCTPIIQLHKTVLKSIDAYLIRAQGIPFKGSIEDIEPLYLIAQFLQGVELSFSAILDGLYVQAANLQKQQIETLTALEEARCGKRRDTTTPNVQNRMPHFKAEYQNLNNAAHPSNRAYIISLSGKTTSQSSGPSSVPQFRLDLCESMLRNHCTYLIHLWSYMSSNYSELLGVEPTKDECASLLKALSMFESIQENRVM